MLLTAMKCKKSKLIFFNLDYEWILCTETTKRKSNNLNMNTKENQKDEKDY